VRSENLAYERAVTTPLRRLGGWSKALLALFACHPTFLASAKLFAVPKVPNFFFKVHRFYVQ
jgi:hypothetical protein